LGQLFAVCVVEVVVGKIKRVKDRSREPGRRAGLAGSVRRGRARKESQYVIGRVGAAGGWGVGALEVWVKRD
jgi:hypothetical protein